MHIALVRTFFFLWPAVQSSTALTALTAKAVSPLEAGLVGTAWGLWASCLRGGCQRVGNQVNRPRNVPASFTSRRSRVSRVKESSLSRFDERSNTEICAQDASYVDHHRSAAA